MTTVDRSRLMTAVAATILLAAILLAETRPTEAAFPGSNGGIVFASGQEIAGGTEGDTDIFTMNPDGTGLTQLTGGNNVASDGDPAFSPDGTQIAFVKQTGIWVMNTDGTSQRFVVGIAEPAVARPAFSPDGTKLAYVCNAEAGNRDVCTVNLDGTEQTRITSHPKDDVEPAWWPDGTRIAFASTRDEVPGTQNYDVFTMDADGSDPINLTNRPGNDLQPNWSPDGTSISFASHYSPTGLFRNREIWSMNANGTSPARLTNDASLAANPVYLPDGTKIAYETPKAGNPEIYIIDADGSDQTRITYNESVEDRPLGATYDGKPDWQPLTADLSLTKAGSPDTAAPGQDLTYTLTTTNNGPAAASNILLTDPLPPNTTFVSASSGCAETAGTVTANLATSQTGRQLSPRSSSGSR